MSNDQKERASKVINALHAQLSKISKDVGHIIWKIHSVVFKNARTIATAFFADIVKVANGNLGDVAWLTMSMREQLQDVANALKLADRALSCPFEEGDDYYFKCASIWGGLRELLRTLQYSFHRIADELDRILDSYVRCVKV